MIEIYHQSHDSDRELTYCGRARPEPFPLGVAVTCPFCIAKLRGRDLVSLQDIAEAMVRAQDNRDMIRRFQERR